MDNQPDKIIASFDVNEWEIETDTGWEPVSHFHITKQFSVWILRTESGKLIEAADEHLVFDSHMKPVFVRDLSIGDFVQTETGVERVVEIRDTKELVHMFDLTVESENHRFYGNGILSHNTSFATAIILHYAMFNENKSVALLANKGDTAREILHRIKLAYEYLPVHIKPGVKEWNKGSVEFENGSKIIAAASSSSAIRGKSVSMLYVDEMAFVNQWEEFSASVLPVLSSGEETKLIFTSTPNGLNHFYGYVEDAKKATPEQVKSGEAFDYIEVPWYDVPGRTEKWKKAVLADINNDEDRFLQEYECSFLSKSGTLISGHMLRQLVAELPVRRENDTKFYELPIPGAEYFMIVDVSRGKQLDYSAAIIFRKEETRYIQCAVYRSNDVPPLKYAMVLTGLGKYYNSANILVEINDAGCQVADSLWYDFEYENLIKTVRIKNSVTPCFGSPGAEFGVRTTRSVKATGCLYMKQLVETNMIKIVDKDTIDELRTFVQRGVSYEADDGSHDDLAMCLVLFSWLIDSPFFKGYFETNARDQMYKRYMEEAEQASLPMPQYHSGVEEHFS